MYQKGSEWRRWDLHVHTKGTLKNDEFKSVDFNAYCVVTFKKALEKDIAVIGITDYFSIERYKEVKQFVANIDQCNEFTSEERDKIKKIFILPNVELRMMPVTDSGRLVNIHCLFNPEEDFLRKLDNDFFNSLEDSGENKMNRDGIIQVGKNNNGNLNGDAAYRVGVKTFHLEISALSKLFKKKSYLKENTIIVVSNSNKDGASAMQKHYSLFEGDSGAADDIRSNIYKLSDAIFSGNSDDRTFFLGLKDGSQNCEEEVIRKCGSLKPCIHGSDAHNEDRLFNPEDRNSNDGKPEDKKYCWIKADPTFKGLKQIICEPEDRVRIQEHKPEEKIGYEVIDAVEITGEICNQTIQFNPNLNTIIGGRSTGKSTLLELIADQFNHVRDRVKKLKDRDDAKGITVNIMWKDGEINNDRDIEFFGQNYMYDIAMDSKERNKLIIQIIRKESCYALIEEYKTFRSAAKSTLQSQIDSLFELNKEKNELEKNKGDEKDIAKEIDTLNKEIEKTKRGSFSEEDMGLYREKKQAMQEKIQLRSHLQSDIKEIERLKNSEEFFGESNLHRFNDLSEESRASVCAIFGEIQERFLVEWKGALNDKINTLEKEVEQCHKFIKGAEESEVMRNGNEYFKDNQQQKELNARLDIESKKLIEVNAINKKIKDLKEQESVLFNKVIEGHVSYWKKAQDLKSCFEFEHDDILIKIESKFNDKKCGMCWADFIDLRSHDGDVKDFISKYEENVRGEIETFLKNALLDKFELKSHKDIRDLTKELLSENWFWVDYELIYQEDNFEQMSDGKKAFVILKLLLDCSDKKCPILIDQPEDDLDNRAIYRELVAYIKNKKKERQIILVTHNANVVVNADAEEVIVANQHANNSENEGGIKFQYVSGSLEDTFLKKGEPILKSQGIREHVCEILEGGKEAFERRDKKYGF